MRLRLWLPTSVLALIAVAALVVPLLHLPLPTAMDIVHRLARPSEVHPLGQDEYGRDELARLLWGARVSLGIVVFATALSCLAGAILGLMAGFLGGAVELTILRAMDALLCLPQLLLALLAVTVFGAGGGTLVPVLSIVYLPGFVRVTYAGARSARSQDYVDAMRVLGARQARIMLRTILPNIAGPVLVQFSLTTAAGIMLESGLSFVGLGVLPPASSWGQMIGAARANMAAAPMLLVWPCLALIVTVLCINAICDALRDVLDPQGRTGRVPRRTAALPPAPSMASTGAEPLELGGLTLEIGRGNIGFRPVRDVSLQIGVGETLALVGESGSGKSLTGLAIAGLLPPQLRVVGGAACVMGNDMLRLPESRLRRLRGKAVAMIFQDPASSLNPMQRVGRQVADALRAHQPLSRAQARAQVETMFRRVGIPDPARRVDAYPHFLSGGMRQRVMIAIAVANTPSLLIADEPTTALDVTVQAQVLQVLAELKRDSNMGVLFITHSLPVVREIADRVAVMYAGEIVEQGPAEAIFARPLHPYTAALLHSVPGEDGALPVGIPGMVPPPTALPPGCLFAPRCDHRRAVCDDAHPALAEVAPQRLSRCVRWREVA